MDNIVWYVLGLASGFAFGAIIFYAPGCVFS